MTPCGHVLAGVMISFLTLHQAGAAGDEADPGAGGKTISITADEVEIGPSELNGIALLRAYELTASDSEFGGISGLLVSNGRMIAITDNAHWISATLTGDGARPLADARIAPMTDRGGRAYGKPRHDSEGLAIREGHLWVSFERDHRLLRHRVGGQMEGFVRNTDWNALPSNGGLEALATLPDGRLLALGEEPADGAFPLFAIAKDGTITNGVLPQTSRHRVTGADLGPDGRLYVLFRHWSLATGVSIRLRRYALAEDGFPDPQTAETLAAFESDSGIDNMEGVALWRDGAARLRLWMVSDDNFRMVQRTLLLDFVVEE